MNKDILAKKEADVNALAEKNGSSKFSCTC